MSGFVGIDMISFCIVRGRVFVKFVDNIYNRF